MESYSDFLYAKPSFLEGVARIFDFGGTLNGYNDSPTGEEADAAAIRSDWEAIGQDMHNAIESFEKEQANSLRPDD